MLRVRAVPVDSVSMHAKPQILANAIQAVFLDVDGTYADSGVVTEAHAAAVRAARAAGPKLLLCTRNPYKSLAPRTNGCGKSSRRTSATAQTAGLPAPRPSVAQIPAFRKSGRLG